MLYDSSQTNKGISSFLIPLLYIICLCPLCVFYSRVSVDVRADRLSPLLLTAARLFPISPSIRFHPSLCFLIPPHPIHSVCHFASLSRRPRPFPLHVLIQMLSFPPLPVHSICLTLLCCQRFLSSRRCSSHCPPLLIIISQESSPTLFFQAWCFHILQAYGQLVFVSPRQSYKISADGFLSQSADEGVLV